MDRLGCTILTCRCSVCAISIPYLALFPKYLSSDDKTWYNANVQILHQVVINLSVIATGILNVRRFLSDLQTGRLGMSLNDHEIEMTTSENNSKNDHSQNSALFDGGQRSTRNQSHIVPIASVLKNPEDMRLPPDRIARYTAKVVGGGGSNNVDDEISDDGSTSNLTKNGVYQNRKF